jgi:hypothetical protein
MSGDDDSGRPPADVVPVAFAAVKAKRKDPEPSGYRDRLLAMKDRVVDVLSNGLRYRGVLVGADEEELYLRGEVRWIVLPLDRITSVNEVKEVRRPLGGPDPRQTGEHGDAPDDALHTKPDSHDDGRGRG